MRGLGRVRWVAVLAAAFGLHAGLGAAATVKTETLAVSGSLTYTWQGDPNHGCAPMGLCGTKGELVMRPVGAQTVAFGRGTPPDIFIDASGVVRVLRAGAGECVDSPDEAFNGLDLRLLSPNRATAVLATSPSSGRCAGPLQSDLAGISFAVTRTGGSRPSFAIRGTRSFAAGPFSGSAVADLALKAVLSNQPSGTSSRFTGSFFGPSRSRFESVQLAYRVASTSNAIQTLFGGATDGSCQIVDSCGAAGSLTLGVRLPGTLSVFANRQVHQRRGRGQALTDFRHGRLRVDGFGNAAGDVTETYNWGDGTSCQDSASTPPLQLMLGSPNGPGARGMLIPVALTSNSAPGIETLRTHCPGPADADLFGQTQVVARGSLTAGQLLSKHLTLELSEPSSFIGFGYTGSRKGSIRLELTLTRVNAGTTT